MSDKTKISTIYSGVTTALKEGMAVLEDIIVIAPQRLFVLFAYAGKTGSEEMKLAAKYKKIRLEKKYPNAEVRIIDTIRYPSHFKAEWTKLYLELTESETANKYLLYEIHFFGHGEPLSLNFEEEGGIKGANSKIFFNEKDNMEHLPWADKGIFVLHSCRSAAFEDTFDDAMFRANICIANIISDQQKTRCLGQIFYASFCPDFGIKKLLSSKTTTAEEDAERFINRPPAIESKVLNEKTEIDRVLWAYAKLNGKTGEYMRDNQTKYMQKLNRAYPISAYVECLSKNNQIMPCRIFKNGKLVHNGIVALGFINKEDLEYI